MILYHQWISLPIETRGKIAKVFGIVKKHSTEVFNNTIKSDGYEIKDIETALSIQALQEFVNEPEQTNHAMLWNLMLDKINGVIKPIVIEPLPVQVILPVIPEEQIALTSSEPKETVKPKSKRGRPKKK